MATIRDIAKITGYSVTTVSRVINNHPYVTKEKKDHINQVIKEMNYVPNQTARNLSSGKSQNIGVLVPFINQPYYDQMLKGINKAAFENDYRVTLLPTDFDPEIEMGYLEEFSAKGFDGLIVVTRANHLEVFDDYRQYGPIVFCEEADGSHCGAAYPDITGSMMKVLSYFKDKGIKRVGLTLGRDNRLSCNSKTAIALCQEYFPEFTTDDIMWNCHDLTKGKAAAAFFKERGVDAILANGDEIAAIILKEYEGGKAPLIVGRDNLLVGEMLGLPTVDHQLIQCGETAFNLFYEESSEKIKQPFEFIKR
ncbi:LacI family DNA-binding transcriptional regulator [Vagococcus coleopterorum]|uniref:LacI family DNA-binding transcriptional regulator n=1 Tax=Vagococcus coleopterorum TaxID=2714946 RepID=A0A6G8AP57_9ENTE|nr:LacI family DNA-binding transcriptional regulator [Vagococcus coleopterorum]QIL46864.1 LacI family DNA-binding transcriptional regulator [Vagococcus coleopterorum]